MPFSFTFFNLMRCALSNYFVTTVKKSNLPLTVNEGLIWDLNPTDLSPKPTRECNGQKQLPNQAWKLNCLFQGCPILLLEGNHPAV